MAVSTTFQQVLDAVARYYGSGSDQWVEIAKYGVRPDNIEIVQQVPGVQVYKYLDGSIANIVYNEPFSTEVSGIGDVINSNVQSGTLSAANSFKASVPVNATVEQATGNYAMASGSIEASSGSALSTVVAKVGPPLAAVTVGASLGKYVSRAFYEANPDYWDRVLPTMNPDTWSSIIFSGDDPLREKFIGALLGINSDNSSTMYMDEDAYTYMAYALARLGIFPSPTYSYNDFVVGETVSGITGLDFLSDFINIWETLDNNPIRRFGWTYQQLYDLLVAHGSPDNYIYVLNASQTEMTAYLIPTNLQIIKVESEQQSGLTKIRYTISLNDSCVRLHIRPNRNHNYAPEGSVSYTRVVSYVYQTWAENVRPSDSYGTVASCGLNAIKSGSSPSGITDQPGYVAPDTSNWDTPENTKQSLKQQYPNLWNNSVYNDVPQSDGTTKRKTYVPVPTVKTPSKDEKQPTNETVPKNNIKVRPDTDPNPSDKEQQDTVVRYITDTTTDNPQPPDVENPPDTGGGDAPPITIPTGQASALWSVYNPSQAQLDSFGSWLWSSDFFSQLKKLFNDPMQAIIGVHKVFATPKVSGQSTIKCGYIDSEVSSNVVGSQYTTVDCGSVSLREYFGNVFDYSPYTEVKLFLPFIGVVPLDVAYVMRGSISVKYHVDVITGACLAEVSIRRDSAGGVIYTFGGSCIVQYPVSSGSYMSVISGVLGTVASGVMAGVSIGTGNPIGAVYGISGAVQSALNTHTNVQHSGGFTGCTGAMGGKKPYLIISRPQTELNGHEPHMSGFPSNDYITLSDRSGFVKCKHVHVTGIDNATANEKDEIERLLKQGVMI